MPPCCRLSGHTLDRPEYPRLALNRGSPLPLYFQIERTLEQEITSGRWPPGHKMPSEPELARHFGVSRSVIRQALGALEHEALIVRRHGQGSFVGTGRRRSWLLDGVEGFFQDEVVRQGRTVRSDVLRAELEPFPRWASEALEVDEGTTGVVLERLRYVDDQLTVYDLNYLPERFSETVMSLRNDPQGSLYEVLRREHGVEVAGGRRMVDAVSAGARFAKLLDVKAYTALLVVEAVDWSADERPFDCYRTWLRPDRMKIEVDVVTSRRSRA